MRCRRFQVRSRLKRSAQKVTEWLINFHLFIYSLNYSAANRSAVTGIGDQGHGAESLDVTGGEGGEGGAHAAFTQERFANSRQCVMTVRITTDFMPAGSAAPTYRSADLQQVQSHSHAHARTHAHTYTRTYTCSHLHTQHLTNTLCGPAAGATEAGSCCRCRGSSRFAAGDK